MITEFYKQGSVQTGLLLTQKGPHRAATLSPAQGRNPGPGGLPAVTFPEVKSSPGWRIFSANEPTSASGISVSGSWFAF